MARHTRHTAYTHRAAEQPPPVTGTARRAGRGYPVIALISRKANSISGGQACMPVCGGRELYSSLSYHMSAELSSKPRITYASSALRSITKLRAKQTYAARCGRWDELYARAWRAELNMLPPAGGSWAGSHPARHTAPVCCRKWRQQQATNGRNACGSLRQDVVPALTTAITRWQHTCRPALPAALLRYVLHTRTATPAAGDLSQPQ